MKLINNIFSELIINYSDYYYNIIAFISNLDNKMDISIALSYLIDDYNDNAKNLGIIFNCNEKNIIKCINKTLNNIIDENAKDKFNRFLELNKN